MCIIPLQQKHDHLSNLVMNEVPFFFNSCVVAKGALLILFSGGLIAFSFEATKFDPPPASDNNHQNTR